MKKLLLIAATVVMAGATVSCKSEQTNKDAAKDSATTQTDSTAAATDQAFATKKLKVAMGQKSRYELELDYPISGKPEVMDAIRLYLLKQCGTKATDLNDPIEAIKASGQAFIAEGDKTQAQFADEEYPMPPYTSKMEIDIECNYPTFITYEGESYIYTGGAHGMPMEMIATFDANTGKQLTFDDLILPNSKGQLLKLIQKHVLAQDEYQSSTLNDFFEFTLPSQAPALKSDGVKFQYQAYEICCYAMGMPDCTIPYDEIRPMLTDYAKQLIAGIQKKD
ncbi:MAG: DUF3298 and DUF4163 domain-containing protein [Prevotellamassilia sp.]|nr:DUF3298 and DUF4163 domain-containing protein [Prevotellamassilia sp.]